MKTLSKIACALARFRMNLNVARLALATAAVLCATPAMAVPLPAVGSGTLRLHLSADTGVTTSGSDVVSWADPAHSVTFTSIQGTDPNYVASGFGKKPTIRFNGTSDSLQTTNNFWTGLTNSFTAFFVISGVTNPAGLFESAPGNANTARFFDANEFELWSNNPDAPVTAHTSGSIIGIRADTSPSRSLNILEWSTDGQVVTSDASASTTAINWINPIIGEIYNNVRFFGGDVSEVIFYDDTLSEADFTSVAFTLAYAYGVVPEPSTFSLASLGLLGLVARRPRRRK